jgi:hypothetical protein
LRSRLDENKFRRAFFKLNTIKTKESAIKSTALGKGWTGATDVLLGWEKLEGVVKV